MTSYIMGMARVLLPSYIDGAGAELLPSLKELRTMLEAFAPISDRFQIYTFCDAIAMTGGRSMGFGDSMTYYMGLPNEELLHINATYIDMIKFPSADSADYQKVLAILRRIPLQHGLTPRNNNWRADQLFRLDGLER
jgi:hypothetical protein